MRTPRGRNVEHTTTGAREESTAPTVGPAIQESELRHNARLNLRLTARGPVLFEDAAYACQFTVGDYKPWALAGESEGKSNTVDQRPNETDA